jgi:uncharacterized protein YaaR (DUF327 family)
MFEHYLAVKGLIAGPDVDSGFKASSIKECIRAAEEDSERRKIELRETANWITAFVEKLYSEGKEDLLAEILDKAAKAGVDLSEDPRAQSYSNIMKLKRAIDEAREAISAEG